MSTRDLTIIRDGTWAEHLEAYRKAIQFEITCMPPYRKEAKGKIILYGWILEQLTMGNVPQFKPGQKVKLDPELPPHAHFHLDPGQECVVVNNVVSIITRAVNPRPEDVYFGVDVFVEKAKHGGPQNTFIHNKHCVPVS